MKLCKTPVTALYRPGNTFDEALKASYVIEHQHLKPSPHACEPPFGARLEFCVHRIHRRPLVSLRSCFSTCSRPPLL